METINLNGENSSVKVQLTESGANKVAWQQFGVDCKSNNLKDIHDVMNYADKGHINYSVNEMPLMRVPQELIDAIQSGETYDWNNWKPTLNDIIKSHKATMRTDSGQNLGIVGKGYGIVQNTKAFDFMDFIKEVSGNEPNIETFGALGNGERMFITATLGKDCFLNPNDAIKNYVVFTNSHDGTGGVMAFFTPIRIICQNTLNMAIRGCANKVVFKHTSKVEERLDWTIERNKKIAAELFSKSVNFSKKFMDNMLNLKEQRVTAEDVRDFTAKMYLNDTQFNLLQKANHNLDKVDEISTRTKNLIQQLRDTTEFGVGQEQNRGTKVWLLNGVTTYLQNSKGWLGKEQEQFNSLMFGEGQKKVQRAYDMLMAA